VEAPITDGHASYPGPQRTDKPQITASLKSPKGVSHRPEA